MMIAADIEIYMFGAILLQYYGERVRIKREIPITDP